MRSHFIGAILAVVAVMDFSLGLLAQTVQPSGVTGNKTSGPGGHPADLSGVWGRYMNINDRTFTQDKTPAMTPWGEERFKAGLGGAHRWPLRPTRRSLTGPLSSRIHGPRVQGVRTAVVCPSGYSFLSASCRLPGL